MKAWLLKFASYIDNFPCLQPKMAHKIVCNDLQKNIIRESPVTRVLILIGDFIN